MTSVRPASGRGRAGGRARARRRPGLTRSITIRCRRAMPSSRRSRRAGRCTRCGSAVTAGLVVQAVCSRARCRCGGPAAGEAEDEGAHARACRFRECTASVTADDLDDLTDGIDDVALCSLEGAHMLLRDGRCAVWLVGCDKVAEHENLRVDLRGCVLHHDRPSSVNERRHLTQASESRRCMRGDVPGAIADNT